MPGDTPNMKTSFFKFYLLFFGLVITPALGTRLSNPSAMFIQVLPRGGEAKEWRVSSSAKESAALCKKNATSRNN